MSETNDSTHQQQQANRAILTPSFSTLIDSPFLLNSVLISRNEVSSVMEEEEKKATNIDDKYSEDNLEDKKSISDNKHVGEYMKNLYVHNNDNDEDVDYIKKSQDLMKSIRNGKVIEYEDVSNEHLSPPRDTLVIGKNEIGDSIGSERFSVKPTIEKSEKSTIEKPKKEKKERRDSGKNEQSSIIDTIFSPFSWMVGGSSKRSAAEQQEKKSSEKATIEEKTPSSQSSEQQSPSNENSNNSSEEKKAAAEPSILSTIFSSSLFSSKKNSESSQSEEPK
ncbi:predicted protein [Naegleria gruberi]|uniref:Predicted protein n=1 Tax=Naegleria gruberi TaxID=5762 RepID=D2VEJ7_NAEGR|nr:uncharacterized protein NAEGRDRAFT_48911 [Naegleria gruberi]EFC44894.1 predicted protein [Naegleria gruberi]|eukprot:XP_002677638.1 predicted protein [Naegleria gruberi strain NEG-M]